MLRAISAFSVTGMVLVLLAAAPGSASAQSGLGLKAHLVYNASTAQTFRNSPDSDLASEFAGFNLGLEYGLPFGLSIGATGYASGDPRDTDRATVFMLLGETNYYFDIPALPIRPFVGAHIGLGTFAWDVRDDVLGDDFGDLDRARFGWQAGVRVNLIRQLSVEAMYRRLSASAESAQDPGFEANQVLIGIRAF